MICNFFPIAVDEAKEKLKLYGQKTRSFSTLDRKIHSSMVDDATGVISSEGRMEAPVLGWL